jgi:hypothetical protein
MKIDIENTLVRMTPENNLEKEALNNLWRTLIHCVTSNKKLVPVGEYLPGVKEVAVFNIEP